MQQPGEPGRPSAWERALPVSVDLDTPPELFGSDLTHLFDYCRALQGQDAGAARTALSVLDSPHEALRDRDELRAWLFGLARSLSLALCTPGRDGPPYLPAALIAASSQQTDDGVVRAFRALTDRDREILDLVYRHGIRPADLPAVLLVPAAEVYRCLAIAEEEFISLASVQDAGPGAGLEDIATLPLAALPTAESNELRPDARPGDLFLDRSEDPPGDRPDVRTGDLFLDRSEDPPGDRPDVRTGDLFLDRLEDPPGDRPGDLFLDRPQELFLDRPGDRPEDRPSDRPDDRPARRRDGVARGWRVVRPALQFVVAAAIPVAAVLALAHFFAAPGNAAASRGAVVAPSSGAGQANQQGSAHNGSAQPGQSLAADQSAHPGTVGSPTTMVEPTSSASVPANAGLAPAAKPVPCPPGTTANFRWHYAANGSPGGWSGTATQACPGSITMGPQAIGGTLQLTPGTTLRVGYDFTLPGNNTSLTMTVRAAQVSFAVICVSKAVVPSVSTLTVPMRAQTYQITGSQWYPSGAQSSSLVYQGSISVPALCGPAGAISLATGGTFTAILR